MRQRDPREDQPRKRRPEPYRGPPVTLGRNSGAMIARFWTAEKDKQLQRLEAGGLSARRIADRLGTTRNAVIGRSVRLRGLIFPSQLRRQRSEQALRAARLRQKKERTAASLASMRRAISRGTPRDVAIVLAVKAHATYQAIADELGLSRQRVQQIVAYLRPQ
jgi:hypothetical protein